MIVLDATTRKLQLLMDAVATTTESPITITYADLSSSSTAFAGSSSNSISNGVTAVDIVASPGASVQRVVRSIFIYNADTVQHLVTIRYNDNGTTRILIVQLLAPGQTLQYVNGEWKVAPTYFAMDPGVCEGRLTLTTGVPVTVADVIGATNIYFTPYKGNRIALYTNSAWTMYTFAEKTLALGTLTAGLPYDVFAYDSGGAVALELLAWTNSTARATALVLQDGVLCKSGALTRRYLGTFYTTAATTTEDSVANRYVWNYYNRVGREMLSTESSTSWTQTSATFQHRGTKACNCVIGVNESSVELDLRVPVQHSVAAQVSTVGIGNGSVTDISNTSVSADQQVAATGTSTASAHYRGTPGIGAFSFWWLEKTSAATASFFGTNLTNTSGMVGRVEA